MRVEGALFLKHTHGRRIKEGREYEAGWLVFRPTLGPMPPPPSRSGRRSSLPMQSRKAFEPYSVVVLGRKNTVTSISLCAQISPSRGRISKISSANSIPSFPSARRRCRYFRLRAACAAWKLGGSAATLPPDTVVEEDVDAVANRPPSAPASTLPITAVLAVAVAHSSCVRRFQARRTEIVACGVWSNFGMARQGVSCRQNDDCNTGLHSHCFVSPQLNFESKVH